MDLPLGLVSLTAVVIQIWNVEGGLVAHAELTHQARGIGILHQEGGLEHTVVLLHIQVIQLGSKGFLAAVEANHAFHIVLGSEIIDIGVVLGIILPAALTAAPLGVIDLRKFTVDLFGMEEADLFVIELLIFQGTGQEVLCLLRLSHLQRQLSNAPVIIGLLDGDSHGLTVLEIVDLRAGLLFVLLKAGKEALLMVAAGQFFRFAVPPGQHSPLHGIFLCGFIGQFIVKFIALDHALGKDGYRMVTDHAGAVACQPGEPGQPAALFIHPQVGFDGIPVGLRLQNQLQGVHTPIGIPDAVVAMVTVAAVVMDLAVKSDVLAVHAVVVHPAGGTVNGGVEHPLPGVIATGNPDLTEYRVPRCLALRQNGFVVLTGDAAVKALLCAVEAHG